MAGFYLQVHVLLLMISSGFTQREENVALSKRYTQSSFHESFVRKPENAANGITNGHFDNYNCIHTKAGDTKPFWEVDLTQVYPVLNITIFGRTDYLRRLQGVSVSVDGVLCNKIREVPTSQRTPLSCRSTMYGRRVKLEKEFLPSNAEDSVLNICEVQILVCTPRYFGDSCNRPCGKCGESNSYCDRYSAQCQHLRCQPRYTGNTCQECVSHKYGENCDKTCGRCKDNATCRHDNGHCSSGCAAGWSGPKCDTECPAHTFGQDCGNTCGRCKDNVTCHKLSGLCPSDCAAGWLGPRCDKVCTQSTFGDNCNATCGQCKDSATCHHIHGTCSLGCAAGWTGHRCDEVEEEDNTMMLIAAGAGSLLGLIIMVTIVAIIIKKRWSHKSAGVKAVLPPPDPRDTLSMSENAYVFNSSPPPSPTEWTQPAAADSEARWNRMIINILDKLQGSDLEKEFSELRSGKVFECTVAVRRRNRRKNRFKDILPYDHSRVTLENINGEDCSDYINASYIKCYNKDAVYIATQGPMQKTEDDFWRMVWQEHVTQIVMLTKYLTESHKTAAFFKYWPSVGEKKRYGQVDVTCVDEVNKAHFIVRTFSVKQDNEYRHVEQFQFTAFTDQETPSPVSFVGLWRFVNSRSSPHLSSPPIIHCSAGIGLTGVYIALDIVMKQAELESETNIFDVVNRIRLDRCNMVKSKVYYLYLHRAVLEACVSRGTCLDMATFEGVYPELVGVDSPNKLVDIQFQNLRVLPDVRLDDSYAALEDNGDDIKKFLTIQVDGVMISINAFFVPTLLDAHGIIMTPLPVSSDTLWSLVECCSVKDIVMLGNTLCRKMQGAGPYWPTETGNSLKAGPYTVSLTDKRHLATCLIGYSLIWQRKLESGGVQLTYFNDWHEDIPFNPSDLVYLLNTLTKKLCERERAPLLVLCMSALHRDSVARSCLFCVLCHVLGQMTLDGQVDVFTAIRHVQSVVPDFVVTAEQFRFCFQTAQQLLTSDIYMNTMAQ